MEMFLDKVNQNIQEALEIPGQQKWRIW
jgi:hypothetical protein